MKHLFGTVVLIFATLLGCGKKPEENVQQPQSETAQQPKPNPTPEPPNPKQPDPPIKSTSVGALAFTLTADAFEKEFTTDKKAAEAKYVGKIVELNGTVYGVYRYSDKQSRVSLQAADGVLPFCTFIVDDPKVVEKLGKRQTIRLGGKCEVDTILYFLPAEIIES